MQHKGRLICGEMLSTLLHCAATTVAGGGILQRAHKVGASWLVFDSLRASQPLVNDGTRCRRRRRTKRMDVVVALERLGHGVSPHAADAAHVPDPKDDVIRVGLHHAHRVTRKHLLAATVRVQGWGQPDKEGGRV
jgi:hypothetical protein